MGIRNWTTMIRTKNKRAFAITAALVLLLGGGFAFRGAYLVGLIGDGAGWVVHRVVQAVAYRDVSSESEDATAVGRVQLTGAVRPGGAGQASPAVGDPAATASPAPDRAVPEPAEEAVSLDEVPPVVLVTPLVEEIRDSRENLPPYRSFGFRDPMIPLVTPFAEEGVQARFSVHSLVLVGVAWSGGDRAALLEDPAGKSWLFRSGEWLPDGGRVVDVTENSITFAHVRYGETNRFTLRLETREEEN